MHGEQDGAIDQQVALGRIDIAPVSVLAEDRADLLKGRINAKYRDHSSHLHPRDTASDAGPRQGLWSSLETFIFHEKINNGHDLARGVRRCRVHSHDTQTLRTP